MFYRGRRLSFQQLEQKTFRTRIFWIDVVFAIFFLILLSRLFSLQVIHHSFFLARANAIHDTTRTLIPQRGLIYCQDKNKNLIPIAINKPTYTIYSVPKEIQDPKLASQQLANLLPLSFDDIFRHLNKSNDPYEPLLKKTDDKSLVQKVRDLKIKGIYIGDIYSRYYPLDDFASQMIGFVAEKKADGQIKGRYGLEKYYNNILSGQEGMFQGMKDALGRLIRATSTKEKSMVEGASLVTTIDKNIQFASEQALKKLIEGRKATRGSIIVMDPRNGKILALANYPTFNLNHFDKEKDFSIYRNYAVEGRYEPGSVIKPITMAAGLDLHAVTPHTTYVDKGYYEVGGHKLVNYRNLSFGKVDMNKVLEMSIDTGAIFVANKIGLNNLRRYFKRFGLADKTGIDLPDEITGDLSNLEYPKANPTYLATASFGVGIAVTPIELIRAYSAIANKGRLVTPYITESIEDSNGIHAAITSPEQVRVISPQTAETLTTMLVNVIEKGYGGRAKVKGYTLAGKTGTAYVPFENKRGYSDDVIHTFIGFFPAYSPRFLILVKMERPQWGKEAASHTVTLAFKDVEKFIINYYNLPPDDNI